MDCLFCKIAKGKIPAKQVYSDDEIVAFEDINPQAPVHILIIPRRHIEKITDLELADAELVGKMVLAGKKLAQEKSLNEGGLRLVFNSGPDAGQAVFHIHMHLLGGRKFGWPPG